MLTVGIFNAGNRSNIIPDKAELEGTLRTFDLDMRDFIMQRMKETAEGIAKSGGGEASIEWIGESYIPLVNNVALTNRMVPTLQRVVGADKVVEIKPRTPAEDFSFYAQQVPGCSTSSASRRPACRRHWWRSITRHAFSSTRSGLLPALRATLHVAFDYMGSVNSWYAGK